MSALPVPFAFGVESSPSTDHRGFTFRCPHHNAPKPDLVVMDPDGDLYFTVGQDRCILTSKNRPGNSSTSFQEQRPETAAPQGDQGDQATTHTHEDAITFLVCSKALSRASPAWKRLLFGGFLGSKPDDGSQWKVHLPEDKPEPMATIMNIIHYRFEHVPDANILTIENLYDVTVVTDNKNLGNSSHDHIEQCFWISWVLGHDSLFRRIATYIAETSEIDSEGRLIAPSTVEEPQEVRFSRVLAPHTDDLIEKQRTSMITSLLYAQRRFYQDPPSATKVFAGQCSDTRCVNEIIGSLVTSLVEESFWPVPNLSDYRGSPVSLKSKVSAFKINTPHARCKVYFRTLVFLHYDMKYTIHMTLVAVGHLETQRRKSGPPKTPPTEENITNGMG